jgi:hypothetical protein
MEGYRKNIYDLYDDISPNDTKILGSEYEKQKYNAEVKEKIKVYKKEISKRLGLSSRIHIIDRDYIVLK